MHAVQPAPVPEPLAAKLQRLQADALETMHWVMLHLAKSLTTPQEADPAQSADRITTQRARLCLQAARDLLRFRPPVASDEPTDDERGSAASPSPSSAGRPSVRERSARKPEANLHAQRQQPPLAPRGRMRVPSPGADRSAAVHGESRLSQRIDASHPSQVPAPAPMHEAAPETEDSRPPSSTPPLPSSHDSSLVAHTSASPPPPPRPRYFTDDEAKEVIAIRRTPGKRFPPRLYNQIIEWNIYARSANLSPSFGMKEEEVEARKPLEPDPPPSSPA